MDLDLYADTEYPLDFDDDQEFGKDASEEEYDAINDETFGVEVGDIAELEDFANQTAHLRLEEINAPHPSQLPMPENFKDEKPIFPDIFNHHDENLVSRSLTRLVGAKTIDEIEQEQLKLANATMTSISSIWNSSRVPMPPTTSAIPTAAPITAEELERKILLESANLAMSPSIRPPPFTPQAFAQFHQQMRAPPPPGLPPNQQSLYARPPPGFFMPPPPTLPGIPNSLPNLPPPFPFPPNLSMPPMNSMPFIPPSVLNMRGRPPQHNMRNLRPKRKEGMPSIRTISDFACDPFAGFMSKKEREWLIKIQIIQCLGTGDPSEDDFYYHRWRKQRVLEKLPETRKVPKEKAKYYSIEDAYPSNYTPPSFAGSLGKPSMCTTSFPRQMIEVHSENPDEDEHKSTPSNSQKKLRALLMQIENASITLLECESIRHRLEKTEPTDINDLLTTLNSKLESIMTSVVTDEHLPMVMIIQKGRHFLGRLIEFSDTESRKEIFKAILDGVPKFSKKMDADAQSNSLLTSISNAISQLKNEDFYSFFEAWKMSQIGALLTIQFVQQFIMAILIGMSRIRHFCPSANKCNLCTWLLSKTQIPSNVGKDFKSIFEKNDLINAQEWLSSIFAHPGNLAELLVYSLS